MAHYDSASVEKDLLLQAAQSDAWEDNRTALHYAAPNQSEESGRGSLEGADPNSHNRGNCTFLHKASMFDRSSYNFSPNHTACPCIAHQICEHVHNVLIAFFK